MFNLKGKKIYIWLVISIAAVFIFFIARSIFFNEKRRVRKFILQGKKAVEAKNIFTCVCLISTQYSDKYGNDRQSLIYIARNFFGYYEKISVNIKKIEINLGDSKKQASVEITAQVLGQFENNDTENILEGEEGGFRVRVVKEDKKWRLLELEFFEPITVMGRTIIIPEE